MLVSPAIHTLADAREQRIWELLGEVPDPEIPVLSIVDLGIVRHVRQDAAGGVSVGLTPTYSGCPATEAIRAAVRAVLDGNGHADVRLEEGRSVTVVLGGEPVELSPDDVALRVRGQQGFAVSREGGEVVALDLTLDEGLRKRGLAREVVRQVQDLRKTSATYHDENVPESSVEILGHSVGGITYRHYAHRAPLAFKAIMTIPQPTAFSALTKGGDGECPCCRRPFAKAA